jgi:signal recognition particle subunit SEC65
MQDVQQAAQKLGYRYLLFEMSKRHPRDPWQPGRMRLELLNADSSPVVPGITTKLQLLGRLADVVPTLEIYAARMAHMQKMREAHAAAQEKAARAQKGRIAKAVAETAAQTGGAAAKKNKKK